ncbi:unnamed protein product [Adineta steineri]|uniref:Uncharacterized protein n=1 Tax=Adineta steineri TaxID=433720 RepID=A0A819N3J6_9BILA|nr:unnamed protein product [Adineta steineri]CAF3988366.1 unnamed protein product [Adineta steineri]
MLGTLFNIYDDRWTQGIYESCVKSNIMLIDPKGLIDYGDEVQFRYLIENIIRNESFLSRVNAEQEFERMYQK